MAKIRKTELKQDYVDFLKKEEKEDEKAMLIIEELAMQRGEQRAKLELMDRMVQSHMPVKQIASLLEVSEEEIQKIISATMKHSI